MECVWNLIDDLEKVTGGGSEAFWLRAHQGFNVNLDKDVELDPSEEDALSAEIDEFVDGMRRFVRTRGAKVEALGSDVANFNGPADAILTQIAGGSGIPKRILLGSERGDLASTQDRSNWHERVIDRQNQWAGPSVVRQAVDRFINYKFLPTPKEYTAFWPLIENLDEVQKVEVAERVANINQKMGVNVIDENEMRQAYFNKPPRSTPELPAPTPEPDPANILIR
jgi:hypothetical protein